MDLARLLADLGDIRAPITELAAPRLPYARLPLNLTHWANPYAARVKAPRRACVNAAREAYPC